MEEDFSDFKNGEVAQPGSSGRLKPYASQVQILPSPQDDITWTTKWDEELVHLADQVAKGYGVVATDEEIDAWAENLSSICAKIND